jgi:hypothetical protein
LTGLEQSRKRRDRRELYGDIQDEEVSKTMDGGVESIKGVVRINGGQRVGRLFFQKRIELWKRLFCEDPVDLWIRHGSLRCGECGAERNETTRRGFRSGLKQAEALADWPVSSSNKNPGVVRAAAVGGLSHGLRCFEKGATCFLFL